MPIADDFAGIAAGMRALQETEVDRMTRSIRETLEQGMQRMIGDTTDYERLASREEVSLRQALARFEGCRNTPETRRDIAEAIRPFIPVPPLEFIRFSVRILPHGVAVGFPDQGPGWEGGSDGAE